MEPPKQEPIALAMLNPHAPGPGRARLAETKEEREATARRAQ